ncbi:MAG: HYR domain-containing protein [Chitinophagales bacterium]|nr:HYR domain-containing protein [Chitinophagales bacterium]MDW8418157.1 LamG-like jellyroll fold domain-containing protein [Chitinophagales bacterium]
MAFFKFDGNLHDASPFQNHGSKQGQIFYTHDRFGNEGAALEIKGLNGYVTVPSSDALRSITNTLTITFWVKPLKAQPNQIDLSLPLFSKGTSADEIQFCYFQYHSFGDPFSRITLNKDYSTTDLKFYEHPIELERWYFISLVIEDGWAYGYINGKLAWQNLFNTTIKPNDLPLIIGRVNSGGMKYFTGCLDDLRIYNRALRNVEIANLYTEVLPKNTNAATTDASSKNIATTTNENANNKINTLTDNASENLTTIEKSRTEPTTVKPVNVRPVRDTVIVTTPDHTSVKKGIDPSTGGGKHSDRSSRIKCPPDTFITLPEGRRGIVFRYEEPTRNNYRDYDSIVQTVGAKSGCFLTIGEHYFEFMGKTKSGQIDKCGFKVTIETEEAPLIFDLPQKVEVSELGNDSVNYQHDAGFKTCLLTAVIYDDGQDDNDIVSLIFNGKVILDHAVIKTLQKGAHIRVLTLNPNGKNYLIAKAWNTGKVGLNTLKIDFYEGDWEEKPSLLKTQKPTISKVLHSKPGLAGGIKLQCNN